MTDVLNLFNRNLQFTLEIENNDTINLLDLKLSKSEPTRKFNTYTNPTENDQNLHFTSHHPHNQKTAAYSSFIHKLLYLQISAADYNQEVLKPRDIEVLLLTNQPLNTK